MRANEAWGKQAEILQHNTINKILQYQNRAKS